MPRSNSDLLAIKAEITNDPTGLGLSQAATPAADAANADALNLVRATISVERASIPVSLLIAAVDRDEFVALAAADKQWLQLIASVDEVDPRTNSEIREGLLQLFNAGSGTRTNLLALLNENCNRIEQLFRAGTLQVGGTVTPSDIADARRAT